MVKRRDKFKKKIRDISVFGKLVHRIAKFPEIRDKLEIERVCM